VTVAQIDFLSSTKNTFCDSCLLAILQGFDKAEGGGIRLISHIIQELLNIPVSVLMGANLAPEVANEMFCETTIG